jgi:methoxymalonate biosynthesis acyl carrier protein
MHVLFHLTDRRLLTRLCRLCQAITGRMLFMDQIAQELERHIRERYEIEEDDDEFTHEVHLFDYGYIDSIGATALIAYIEQTYGVQVTNQDLMLYSMNTINEIAAFIRQKTAR